MAPIEFGFKPIIERAAELLHFGFGLGEMTADLDDVLDRLLAEAADLGGVLGQDGVGDGNGHGCVCSLLRFEPRWGITHPTCEDWRFCPMRNANASPPTGGGVSRSGGGLEPRAILVLADPCFDRFRASADFAVEAKEPECLL